MEAEEIAWKGMKGIGKGLKAGASGALKVAEKTSMAVLETNDKINELQYAGASGPKKTTHLDSDARAAMKARAAAAKEPEMEDLGPDQSGDGFLGDLKSRAKSATDAVASTTATVAAKTKETAGAATAKTLEVGKATGGSVMAVAGLDDTAAARERAAGGGQEIQFDEDGNPIIPDAPAKGAVATAGGIVGGVVGKTGGLVGAVVGTTLEVGQKAGGGLKDVVVGDDKDAARARAAVRRPPPVLRPPAYPPQCVIFWLIPVTLFALPHDTGRRTRDQI